MHLTVVVLILENEFSVDTVVSTVSPQARKQHNQIFSLK